MDFDLHQKSSHIIGTGSRLAKPLAGHSNDCQQSRRSLWSSVQPNDWLHELFSKIVTQILKFQVLSESLTPTFKKKNNHTDVLSLSYLSSRQPCLKFSPAEYFYCCCESKAGRRQSHRLSITTEVDTRVVHVLEINKSSNNNESSKWNFYMEHEHVCQGYTSSYELPKRIWQFNDAGWDLRSGPWVEVIFARHVLEEFSGRASVWLLTFTQHQN